MIAKIHTGNNFGGLVNYANDIVKKDAVVVASYGVSLTSNAAITASFKAQAKAHPGVKNFVGHISLSFSPNDKEKVNNDLMAQIAREYMRRMGIVNTQFVVFRHQDQPHPHVHIIYNRVNNDGDAIMGDCNFRKSAAITKALTREYGLTFGKGKKNAETENRQSSSTSKKGGVNHDLNLRFDFSFRNQAALSRDIATMTSAASSGNRALKFSFSADYTLSRMLTMSFFYDQQTNTPLLSSSSYPTTTRDFGLSVKFSLTR